MSLFLQSMFILYEVGILSLIALMAGGHRHRSNYCRCRRLEWQTSLQV
jgi:hypothetical protein